MKTIVLDLMCDLDEAELLDRAQQLSSQLQRQEELQIERANSAKGYKDQLDGLAGVIGKLHRVIRRKTESRPVTCAIVFHSPVVGTKRTVRTDTGEFVRDDAMSATECQNNLFEQPETPAVQTELVPQEAAATEDAAPRAVKYGDEELAVSSEPKHP